MAEKTIHEKRLLLHLEIELLRDIVERAYSPASQNTAQDSLGNLLVEMRHLAKKMKLNFDQAVTESQSAFAAQDAQNEKEKMTQNAVDQR